MYYGDKLGSVGTQVLLETAHHNILFKKTLSQSWIVWYCVRPCSPQTVLNGTDPFRRKRMVQYGMVMRNQIIYCTWIFNEVTRSVFWPRSRKSWYEDLLCVDQYAGKEFRTSWTEQEYWSGVLDRNVRLLYWMHVRRFVESLNQFVTQQVRVPKRT